MITRAVIFDLDGVLSDTQEMQSDAESSILKEYGIFISPQALRSKYAGINDEVMFREIFEAHGIAIGSIAEILQKKWAAVEVELNRGVKPITGSIELVRTLSSAAISLAVASGSPLLFVRRVLSELGIRELFQAVVSADEVANGKPWPDVFLEAARRINVEPWRCLVIEDGSSGMVAARAAGMKCIALTSNTAQSWPADLVVSNLAEVDTAIVGALIESNPEKGTRC